MTVEFRCRVIVSSAPGSPRSNPHVIVLSAFPAPTEKTSSAKPAAFLVPVLYAPQLTIQLNKVARALGFRKANFFAEKGKRITDLVGFFATNNLNFHDPIGTPLCGVRRPYYGKRVQFLRARGRSKTL